MNFWGFHPDVFEYIQKLFQKFLKENTDNVKAEFFIPIIGDSFIHEENGEIKVIATDAKWFGVTYKEDAPEVKQSINELIAQGEYPQHLFA
jgi:hypothetical protein